jgi:Protein of unknown function (DUF1566)/Collagen triple helix repeat (20 copies)/IPT/TIG domain
MKRLTKCATGVTLVVAVVLIIFARPAAAQAVVSLPVINSAIVNYSARALTVSGVNFGSNPTVTLGTTPLTVLSATSTQIVATFPVAMPPSAFAPGDYFLRLAFTNQLFAIFAVTLGATGPIGPQGPQGLQGLQGLQGPAGKDGTNGQNGTNGTNGTNGINGTSATFVDYFSGNQHGCPNGGAIYAAGNPPVTTYVCNGTNGIDGRDGTGGTRADGPCFDDTNRYVDCGNGTVTDTVTGLIWLKQWNCLAPNTWAAANQAAAGLQNGDCGLTDKSAPGDWRLPTRDEWTATFAYAVTVGCIKGKSGGAPSLTNDRGLACYGTGVGSSFAGVLPDLYWSNTSIEFEASAAWVAGTIFGTTTDAFDKSRTSGVWPVRGGAR